MEIQTHCRLNYIISINLAPIHSSNKVIYLPEMLELVLYWKIISGQFFPNQKLASVSGITAHNLKN